MTYGNSVVDVHPHQLDYRLLVEESLAGIYLVQAERFLYVNPTMAELFGYSQAELIENHTVEDLVAPGDRSLVRQNIKDRLDGTVASLQYTFRGLRRDGSTFDVEVRGRRTLANDEPAVIGTLLDVSERSKQDERLRFLARAAELLDSSLDYEATLESLARLMIPFFADLCFIDIVEEQGVRRLAAGPWPGDGSGFNLHPTLETSDRDEGTADVVIRHGTGLLMETVPPETSARITGRLPGLAEDGKPPIHSLIVVPLVARGNIIGAMTLATTVSGRRYYRPDLEFSREVARGAALAVDNARLYHEAQEAIHRRQEVLAVVSHDLRNPLNIILMSTALGLDQERRRQGPLEKVHNAAKEMERLISDLLDLSAIEAGGFSVDPAPRSLAPLIDKCLRMLEPSATNKGVTLVCETEDDSIEGTVDEGRFVQAICNLIGNAIKFSPDGGTVHISIRRSNDCVTVAVRDSGPGIPPDQIGRVFDRFWQLQRGDAGGAGLGLAIVKGIAEAHGGTVRVESLPGDGSVFEFDVPAA
ncbi:MAG: ATP-binding protein [Gemmatimonadota bacterium]